MLKPFFLIILFPLNFFSQNILFQENFENDESQFILNTNDISSTFGYNPWVINNIYGGGSGSLTCLGLDFEFNVVDTETQPDTISNSPNGNYLHISAEQAINSGVSCGSYLSADGFCFSEGNSFTSMLNSISTLDEENVNLSFWWICGGEDHVAYGEIYYSVDDGINWIELEEVYQGVSNWTQTSISNPDFDHKSNLKFGFRFVNNVTIESGFDPGFCLDEITITSSCSSTYVTFQEDVCEEFISPSGNYVWTESGTYLDTLTNSFGCDSVITFILTISEIDTAVNNSSFSLNALAENAFFQWLDCDNEFNLISEETSNQFTPTFSGNYAVEISQNGCVDTSSCYSIIVTDVVSFSPEDKISISHVPFNNSFKIDLMNTIKHCKVEILNYNGKTVMSSEFENQQIIQMEVNVPTGMYFIQITLDNNRKRITRIII